MASVIIRSALPSTICWKIVTLSGCTRIRAFFRFTRANFSLVPPGLTMAVTPGWSICSRVWKRASSRQRVIGVLPSRR